MWLFVIIAVALALAGLAVWKFGLFGTREPGGLFDPLRKSGEAPRAAVQATPTQTARGLRGAILKVPKSGVSTAPPRQHVAPGSAASKYMGSLTGGMLPTGRA